MNMIEAMQIEVDRKQMSIIKDYRRSQEGFVGVRRVFGSTLIALGNRIYGCSSSRREELAERQLESSLRNAA